MQMSWIPPSSCRNFSVLCISRCRSGVAVAGAQKHLERKPPPCSQKGSFQDITPQRVTFATLGITVCFWSSVSICDSFSPRSPPSWLPGHERGATRVLSAQHLATFVLDTEKTQIQTLSSLPITFPVPCPVLSQWEMCYFFIFLPGGQRCCCRNLNVPWRPAAWRGRRCLKSKEGHHLGDKCHSPTHSKSSGKLLFERFEGKLGQSRPIGSVFPRLVRIQRDDGLDSTEYLISVF